MPFEGGIPVPTYEMRYCAFVDILGFKELVEKLDPGDASTEALRSLLTKVHNPPETNAGSMEKAEFRAQSISDAVAMSGAANVVGLAAIIHAINRLAVDLLAQGYFIRGAIVKDQLYHDEKMVFGKALVRAYELEHTVASYPRVMVPRQVVEDLLAASDSATVHNLLRRAEDGPMFVHVLRAVEMSMLPVQFGEDKPRLQINDDKFHGKLMPFAGIADQIQKRYDEASDNPNHFGKVKWFAQYWNETIRRWNIEGFKRIYGPGLDPKPSKWNL
jgi:hypothetical protein